MEEEYTSENMMSWPTATQCNNPRSWLTSIRKTSLKRTAVNKTFFRLTQAGGLIHSTAGNKSQGTSEIENGRLIKSAKLIRHIGYTYI
jgi:hypothetical protein